ncbi:hypothetical protein ACKI1I_28005 [Streptomyces turgidiscabies]|uniref:hypothetical protein n=1 Tax=Streptomyces turgidiscabies TaxID=85558 RepID=UPI0038F6DCB8
MLDFYRETDIRKLADQLLRTDLTVQDPPISRTLLVGVWLTDHGRRHRGNLWVWPGTHLRFGQYLAERSAEALAQIEEMNPGPYPKIELGEPTGGR